MFEGKKLYRSESDQMFAGVCGGIAEYLGIDSTIVRLACAVAMMMAGSGLIFYIAAALIIPKRDNSDGTVTDASYREVKEEDAEDEN